MVTLNAAQINSPKVPSVTEQHQKLLISHTDASKTSTVELKSTNEVTINEIKEFKVTSPQKKMIDLSEEMPKAAAPVPAKKTVVEKMDNSIDLKDISLIDEAPKPQQQQQPEMPSSSRSKQIMDRRALSRAANAIRRAKLNEKLEDLDKP